MAKVFMTSVIAAWVTDHSEFIVHDFTLYWQEILLTIKKKYYEKHAQIQKMLWRS